MGSILQFQWSEKQRAEPLMYPPSSLVNKPEKYLSGLPWLSPVVLSFPPYEKGQRRACRGD